ARLAITAKVNTMPARRGKPLSRNRWSARENTKGSTGKIHGLTIVRMPPANANISKSIRSLSDDLRTDHSGRLKKSLPYINCVLARNGESLVTRMLSPKTEYRCSKSCSSNSSSAFEVFQRRDPPPKQLT